MGVRDQLASLGEDLGNFNQGEFRGTTATVDGADLTKGYCAGVCLDWARRVLLSGSGRDARFLTYAKQPLGSVRQVKAVKRMGTAYAGQGASYVATTQQANLTSQLTALLSVPEITGELPDGTIVSGVPVSNSLAELICNRITMTPNPFDLENEPAGWVPHEDISSWLVFISGPDPQHKKLASGGRGWGQYASQLDAAHTQGKKRKFRDLVVIGSRDQQTYGSEGVWMGILRSSAFQDSRCTIIGLGAPGEVGHAVAVHVVGGVYRFFDPNYGTFGYTEEKLKSALQYLFWAPLFEGEAGLDAASKPVYRRRENANDPVDDSPWTQMSYTIFGKG
jgi:hypothetical protein